MIPEPGDAAREVSVPETFHEQTDDELTEAEIKARNLMRSSYSTIILGVLPEDIYLLLTLCQSMDFNGGNQFRQYVGHNVGNQNRYNAVQNVRNQVVHNAVQNPGVQNVGNQNGLIVVPGIANQNPIRNGNVVAARAEGNANRNNDKRRDANLSSSQWLIGPQVKKLGPTQLKSFDLMAAAADLDEIKEVNVNCILMANLQEASTSGTQTDKAPVYDSDGSAEKALELEIKRLLKAVVSQDIMSIVQNNSVQDTSNLQTELECTKEHFKDYTLDPLPQKLENENVELEFQVRNYEKENAHLKTAIQNLF
ncbi:hypothetical protein Tco_1578283 [Tanacetum coccineum]